MGTVAIKGLSDIEAEFRTIVLDPILKLEEAALVVAVPALSNPILHFVEHESFHLITEYLIGRALLWFDLSALPLANASHQRAWSSIRQKLVIVEHDFGKDSDAYKKANDEAKAAFGRFIGSNQ